MADPDQNTPRNRKERRQAAKDNGKHPSTSTLHASSQIPMAQPDRSGPKGKTLLDIAEERTRSNALNSMMNSGQPFSPTLGDGLARDENGRVLLPARDEDQDPPIGQVGESFFLCTSLTMVHFTLDVLVYHQYAQEIVWSEIVRRTFIIYPILFLAIYLLHSETAAKLQLLRQLFCLSVAVASGCYMIYAGNTFDYFAVMKRAPPLGTLWIWSVIEMKLPYAVASIVVDLAFMFYNGYTVF